MAIAALSQLAAPEARVLRDWELRVIPTTDVMVGDVVMLAEGNIVPADTQVVEAAALLVDEAALSGVAGASAPAVRMPTAASSLLARGRHSVRNPAHNDILMSLSLC